MAQVRGKDGVGAKMDHMELEREKVGMPALSVMGIESFSARARMPREPSATVANYLSHDCSCRV
jgi:hypothetical protein